jgi:hypothetical protein
MILIIIIIIIISLAGLVVRIGESRGGYRVLLGNLGEGDLLEDLGINGRIISKCDLKKSVGRTWTRLIWLVTESSGGML